MTDIELGTLVDGRYKVLSRLGSGGMADVFLAEDQQLGRKVALKLLHRRFAADPGFVERFRREAQSAAGLQHPNVVSTYDRGTFEETYYIAMEYLPGRTLKQLIRQEAPVDPLRAIDITVQILKAARFAHRRGVIHRDLKPHNVIVDDSDHAKVTDFGIARAGASDMTETGSIMGTAQYLSPEQAQGLAVRETSDLYAVAIVLYEMLTGQVPFDAESAVTIALKHVSEGPPPPRSINPSIPPDLEQVVLWALNKKPEDRPQDADQFMTVLEQVREQIAAAARGEETASMAAVNAGVQSAVPTALMAAGADAASAYAVAARPDEDQQPRDHVDHGEEQPADQDREEPGAEEKRGGARVWPWVLGILIVLLLAGGGVAAYLLTRPTKATVPPVVGYTVADATTIVTNDGFTPNVINETSSSPSGTVIAQSPTGGVRINAGSIVTLKVSQGPGQVSVPQVQGDSKSAATKAITAAGLTVGQTLTQSSATIPAGAAIGTDPPYSTSMTIGKPVTLYISSGRALVTVPYVIGLSAGAASAQLKSDGLEVNQTSQTSNDSSQAGNVISQTPSASGTVQPGTIVTIVVATPTSTATATATTPTVANVPNVVGDTAAAASGNLAGAGFNVKQSTEVVNKPNQDGIVTKQSPAGGSATKGTTVTITVGKYQAPVTTTTTKSHTTTTPTTPTTTTPTTTTPTTPTP
ncbi:MAG: Stk1 family PASTA domain-containing Ser/Thr kinase [Solirubrobacteraceae bacterium]